MATRLAAFVTGIALLAIGYCHPAMADDGLTKTELKEGDSVPMLESLDDQGLAWNLADHVGKRMVVLYLYPGDFTGGCLKQAQSFRDGLQELAELDVEVVGVSGDSVETHKLFKNAHCLKHTLLSDPEGKLAEALGAPVGPGGKARTRDLEGQPILDAVGKSIIVERSVTLPRWTFVIGRDGKVLSRRISVNPATDADEVLKIVAEQKP